MKDFSEAITNYLKTHQRHQLDVKAALIDMDGVLYDSMRNHTLAWKTLADRLGITATRNEFYLYEGMTGVATIQLIFKRQFGKDISDAEARDIYKIKTDIFRTLPHVETMPGAYEMLRTLRYNNIERVLVTGSGQADVIARIDEEYAELFDNDKRITATDVKHGKPNPEPYIMGQRLASVQPYESIVIENAPLGVEAGHASGAFTIAVTTGPIPQAELYNAGADLVFSSMPEFAEQLPFLIDQFHNVNL